MQDDSYTTSAISTTHYTGTMASASYFSGTTTSSGTTSSEAISLDMILNDLVELEHFKVMGKKMYGCSIPFFVYRCS
jgi:hypothetical protein